MSTQTRKKNKRSTLKDQSSTKKIRNTLPKLRKIDYSRKRTHYKLNDTQKIRHKAIREGVEDERKYTGKTRKQAAIAKKARFNVLRIYRRNNNKKQCKIITKDMKYMDKKYGLGKTTNIC